MTKWNFKVNTGAGEKHERIITTFCLKRLRSEAHIDNELRVQYKKITSYEKLKIFLLTVFCTPALAQIEATFFNNNKCLLLTSSMSMQNVWSLEGFSLSQRNSRKIILKLKSMDRRPDLNWFNKTWIHKTKTLAKSLFDTKTIRSIGSSFCRNERLTLKNEDLRSMLKQTNSCRFMLRTMKYDRLILFS